jgi:uncharacterized membrane protein YcaP (DUF421 family)
VNTVAAQLGITVPAAAAVVISTAVLYATLGLVLRPWKPRHGMGPAAPTIGLLTLIGGIAARSTLGESPTLVGGLLAIATVVVLERVSSRWWVGLHEGRRRPGNPVILMIGTKPRSEALARLNISETTLNSLLRQAAVWHMDEVAVAVLEPRGAVSVLRRGQPLDASMLAGVEGAEEVPDSMFTA